MAEVTTDILIHAPRERVYAVIADLSSYPDLVPEVQSIDVHEQSEKSARATLLIQVVKAIQYTLDFELGAPKYVRWELTESDLLKKNSGEWWLEQEGEHTRAIYTIDIDFRFFVPEFMKKTLIEASLPAMLKRVKSAAEF